MVSHGVENLKTLYVLVDLLQVLLETEMIVVPVNVPCHVSQRHCVHLLTRVSVHVFGQIAGEHPELRQITGAVGKMHVSEEEHLVLVLTPDFHQREILLLNHGGLLRQQGVKHRKNSLRRHLVAAWHRDGYIAPFLGGFELVYPLVICLGNHDSIGDNNSWNAGTVT